MEMNYLEDVFLDLCCDDQVEYMKWSAINNKTLYIKPTCNIDMIKLEHVFQPQTGESLITLGIKRSKGWSWTVYHTPHEFTLLTQVIKRVINEPFSFE